MDIIIISKDYDAYGKLVNVLVAVSHKDTNKSGGLHNLGFNFQYVQCILLRYFRSLLRNSWRSNVPDTRELQVAIMMSIETMIMKHRLRWSGNLVRLKDTGMPKQAMYSTGLTPPRASRKNGIGATSETRLKRST